jgi:hypothetical protein
VIRLVVSFVIGYRISNILERSEIEDVCARFGSPWEYADNLSDLARLIASREPNLKLIICDLALVIRIGELQKLAALANVNRAKVLGKYPHIDIATRKLALTAGVENVIPNSAFRSKLEQLLQS